MLLVEDEADDIELIRRSLEHTKLHCDLRVAQTLAEGRKEVFDADGTPELVLLDLGLPDGDGADLLKEIKQSAKHAQIPVVIVSASDDEDRVRAAYDQQAACFVSKDLGFADLGEIVRSIGEFWLAVVRLPDVDSSA